jgi:mannose-6-phosphate isomerase-like protein (cupin superfamily)
LGDTLKITPSESVEVVRGESELFEVEGTWGADGSPPPKHYHPDQDERFEVLEGTLRSRVDGFERDLGPGDVLEIPRRAVHQMWNPGGGPTRAIWQTRPAGRTEKWFRAIDRLHREGRVGDDGMPGPLAFSVLLNEYDDVFRLAVPAQPLVRGALAGLAVVGRARGYDAGAS